MRPGRPAIRLAAWNRAMPKPTSMTNIAAPPGIGQRVAWCTTTSRMATARKMMSLSTALRPSLRLNLASSLTLMLSHPSGVLPSVRSSSSESCT